MPVDTCLNWIHLTFLFLLVASNAVAAEGVDYIRDVKPILQERCYACHGNLKQEASLRLDTARAAIAGGESGAAIVPLAVEQSLLMERITGEASTRMPPEGEPLHDQEIELLRRWIEQGANAPVDEHPEPPPETHWAFQPPVMPFSTEELEKLRLANRNVIDELLAREHRARGLTTAPRLEGTLLLRRVVLDLTGLPPSPQQLERFLADSSPATYALIVDELLASPQYGERWGRHWMDIWRYSDWSGEENNQVRGAPQHIWRWRDWIVNSLNDDLGYDQLIHLMLAADEIAPSDQSALSATGFLARNWYKFNRDVWLEDTVEHTAKAFLGLTFNCAKCHDHKYDPISQENYYQFRAFFEPHAVQTDAIPGEADTTKAGIARVVDTMPETPTYLFHRGDSSQPDQSRPMQPGLPSVLGGVVSIQPVSIPSSSKQPRTSTGRRTAFARWLTDSQNPLTARVAVNHIWLRHFGTPLVDEVTDFGLRSKRPVYSELLDALSVEFMQHNWSMKALHRQIVLSSAYCMQSGFASATNLAIDPDNRLLWRMHSRRLEGEAIRDSIFALSGELDLQLGGPEIPLKERESSKRRSMYFRHGHERQVPFLETFDGANVMDCYRRNSTIVPQQALALANDVVIRNQSRKIAEQLSNQFSKNSENLPTENVDFIQAAFRLLLNRSPSITELERCQQFLVEQSHLVEKVTLTFVSNSPPALSSLPEDSKLRGRQSLIHVLLNHNDFVTVR